jgi:hypothetical protein
MSREESDRRRSSEAEALADLRRIPGVGPSIAQDLLDLGIRRVEELRGGDPEELYLRHCDQKGCTVDRCWLYVARCAVYFATAKRPDPEKLKWWNWKGGKGGGKVGRRKAEDD